MDDIRSSICFEGIKHKKHLEKLIHHHIERWLERRLQLPLFSKKRFYQVTFESEEDSHLVSCHLRVVIGSRSWMSHEVGKTVLDALFLALKSLKKEVLKKEAVKMNCWLPILNAAERSI